MSSNSCAVPFPPQSSTSNLTPLSTVTNVMRWGDQSCQVVASNAIGRRAELVRTQNTAIAHIRMKELTRKPPILSLLTGIHTSMESATVATRVLSDSSLQFLGQIAGSVNPARGLGSSGWTRTTTLFFNSISIQSRSPTTIAMRNGWTLQ